MLIDCTDVLADTGATPMEFASLLRQEIHDGTRCNASAGLGMWHHLICNLFYEKARVGFVNRVNSWLL